MPPQWGPQQQWIANPQPGPGRGGGKTKWILGGLVVALAIALAVVITVILVRPDNNSDNTAKDRATGATSEFASANDTGPITIITEDPTCAAWVPIQNTLADSEDNGWSKRDPAIPASDWSPEQRAQHQAVAEAMRSAADQTEPLTKRTPHRVMRQLYEQFIAYSRAYADKIPGYTPPDDNFARTGSTLLNLVGNICAAVKQGSAAARAPLVSPGVAPEHIAAIGDPKNPKLFLAGPDAACTDWMTAVDQFDADSADWRNIPPNIPAGRWSPEQNATTQAVIPIMLQVADTMVEIGQQSSSPALQDFAALSAQYFQAFAHALPTYTPADTDLYESARRVMAVVRTACAAAGNP